MLRPRSKWTILHGGKFGGRQHRAVAVGEASNMQRLADDRIETIGENCPPHVPHPQAVVSHHRQYFTQTVIDDVLGEGAKM
jgi:hypothetical protein